MESSGATPPGGLSAAVIPDIAAAFDAVAPFVTVYLATEPEVEQAAQQNELRWKNLRKELEAAGAPEAALDAIDPLVADAHHAGRTLAVIANATGTLLVRHEQEPPNRDVGRVANLPSVGPLLEWAQGAVPHVIVLADRGGADIVALTREGGSDVTTVGEPSSSDKSLRKVQAGGWSQRRYQNRAENVWEQNAKDVADQLTSVVDETGARLIILAGDVRALEKLRQSIPDRIAGLVREVDGTRSTVSALDEIADDIVKLVSTAAAAETVDLLGVFKQERGQDDLACEGVTATLDALAQARVDTLLIHDDPEDSRTAWFGPAPGMVSIEKQALRDMGADDIQEGRLVDVAIRAALGTGAAVRLIPSVRSLQDGIGAILRF